MRKLLVLLESGLLFVGLCVGLAAWQQQRALEQPLQLTEERLLDVSSGSTPGGMLARLEQEKVLHGAFWLRLYWRFNLPGQALHSGEYRLLPGMKGADLLELWREGEVVQYSLTLVEGWSFRQVREALARQGKLEQTLAGLSDGEIMQRLGKPDEVAEGRFFPDTYRYTRGMRDIDILRKAYQRMQTILAKEWDGRSQDLPYRDAYQALIMASLVEKETGVPEERSQIAGVFVRRLQRGMLLQTDPTVIYGMGERYNGKITRADLREPTPYNTYVVPGMPPTPIALAGREAIRAALHPAEGETLYFVARGDGSHVFSSSLDEHNKAVREYQLKRRSDYRSSPAPITPSPQ
ncbi:TPA: endolytic transglycosylase MltG [Pseudomonas aeruginosa]|nr:endolytic transglycosylase MltG [Pseudomonas aeruginosa]HBO2962704.1 endolytic transglycosylase MltG [Pseudomonas aeruginosa]HBO3063192.1 endolytic transglycosylase MltG [Pseudomonas aeruginosa]HBO3074233.1 endolytic transglycosylase MltG [Pseudomonas aeruginosa]HBP0691595.1 endolytic transglycosylase MltG [Pseudomonas aeruginosa]